MLQRESIGAVLRRGLRRRCPRCGEGALFRRGIAFHQRCSVCQLQFQRNNGDTWMFMIITDRIPLLIAIAALYFGFIATTWTGTAIFCVAVAVPMIATIRQRQGLALALDYLSRVWFRDPSDEIHGHEYVLQSAR
jgi:uncharacterized protein (DUF983 family)